jgi:hypothetical protein
MNSLIICTNMHLREANTNYSTEVREQIKKRRYKVCTGAEGGPGSKGGPRF